MENLIDVGQTLDLVKFKLYNEWLYTSHVYEEGDSDFHKNLTKDIVEKYIDPLELPKDNVILDIGCGPGYFLDEMKQRGYTNLTGITLSHGDIKICQSKGHTVKQYDMSFIPQKDGWYDETVDFIFLRQALEHSPYPIFSLIEYNRLLKQGGKMYIELPTPECDRKHEFNPNHYSIMGHNMLGALLHRTGFKIDNFQHLQFDLGLPNPDNADEPLKLKESYYIVVVTKDRPLDIK